MREPRRHRNDRPIDRIRNAGGQARLEGDVGAILTSFNLREERLYWICERGIASIQMADQIDPERNNPDLPLIVQRPEISYGATTPFIQRTLCVGAELLSQPYVAEHVNRDDALALALEAAEALADVQDNITALAESEAELRRRLDAGEVRIGVIPKTASLKHRVEGSIAGLRKAALLAQGLADLFYPRPPGVNFTEHLRNALAAQLSADDIAWPTLNWSVEALRAISNYRNAMIHPDARKRIVIRDYELGADGVLVAPTVEITHPDTPHQRIDVVQFLKGGLDEVSFVFEAFTTIFSDRNVRQWHEGLKCNVVEDDRDRRTGTRFRWESVWLEGYPKIAPQPVAAG